MHGAILKLNSKYGYAHWLSKAMLCLFLFIVYTRDNNAQYVSVCPQQQCIVQNLLRALEP